MIDVQRHSNNNEPRLFKVSVGTLDTRIEGTITAGEEYVVTTIPINSVIGRVYVVLRDSDPSLGDINVTFATNANVKPNELNGSATLTGDGNGDRIVEVDTVGLLTTEDTPIKISVDTDIPIGKLQFVVEFCDLEAVSHDRVRIAEYKA